ncbi:MAG: FecCD family ABC transporter permease [Planctomycetota bacterium]
MTVGMVRPYRRRLAALAMLLAIAVFAAGLRFLIGREWGESGWRIEFAWPAEGIAGFRIGAISVAATVGAALGLSGLLLQTLLRNPLASPFVLGLSSGATLGLAIAMLASVVVGLGFAEGLGSIVPAFAGAIATLGVVSLAGRRREGLDPLTLVLAGVVISSLCGALLMLVNHLLPPGARGDLVAWTMGRIDEQPEIPLLSATAVGCIAGIGLGMAGATRLDVALLGEDEARSIGVPLGALRWSMLLGAGLLAACAVALAGPIAFVGLVAPHLGRILVGSGHRLLVPASAVAGAALLLVADLARQPIDFGAGRLPIGVLTALVGGPVFLLLLRRGRLEGWS